MKLFIRKVRKEKGLTLEQLSDVSGVSVTHISEIERERKIPTIKVLCQLAKALGVKVEDLYSCD